MCIFFHSIGYFDCYHDYYPTHYKGCPKCGAVWKGTNTFAANTFLDWTRLNPDQVQGLGDRINGGLKVTAPS